MIKLKRFEGENEDVTKYVFENNTFVAESVLYKYKSFDNRTVICCSTMSGCPVGCSFCGTGKKFIRNLTAEEIMHQVTEILKDKNIENVNETSQKFQIMFMSMGEPMLNWQNTKLAIQKLNKKYNNADLLISTIGINDSAVFSEIIKLSKEIPKIGLQFSIHKSSNAERDLFIPFKNKWNLEQIRDAGLYWWMNTGRKVYLNYCVDKDNRYAFQADRLMKLYSPIAFNFTFSVVCSSDPNKDICKNLKDIQQFSDFFVEKGFDTRIFDPHGQDDIGGGCGQLWYVQEWMKGRLEE